MRIAFMYCACLQVETREELEVMLQHLIGITSTALGSGRASTRNPCVWYWSCKRKFCFREGSHILAFPCTDYMQILSPI